MTSVNAQSTKHDFCTALRRAELEFIADNLHETWETPHNYNVSPAEQIEVWHTKSLSKRKPISYPFMNGESCRGSLKESHLADYTVLRGQIRVFDDSALPRARLILGSQPPMQLKNYP